MPQFVVTVKDRQGKRLQMEQEAPDHSQLVDKLHRDGLFVIEVRESSRKVGKIQDALSGVDRRGLPAWLEADKDNLKGSVVSMPSRQDITVPIREQLIVELYSK